MKFVNKILEKYGVDKLLHFFVAAWIIALGGLFGDLGIGIAWGSLLVLMVVKEFIDKKQGGVFDMDDISWGFCGGVLSTMIYATSVGIMGRG